MVISSKKSNAQNKKSGNPIECPRCGYGWRTVSELGFVQCSNCGNRVKNPYGTYWKSNPGKAQN